MSSMKHSLTNDKSMFVKPQTLTAETQTDEIGQVDLLVIRQQVWELRRKHNMEKYCEPKYLILSSAIYEKLRIECGQEIGNYAKDLEVMNKYMGLTVAVIPQTYKVDIIDVAV